MKILTTLSALLFPLGAMAEVTLPAIFADGMVLQRETTVALWGKAAPSSKVKIITSWSNDAVTTTTQADGSWKASVPTPEAGGPYTITLTDDPRNLKNNSCQLAKNSSATTLSDVLIGEVWLCSGQSNMEMPMKGFPSQPIEGGNMDVLHSSDPLMRLFTGKRTSRVTPIDTCFGAWSKCEPANVRNFSATAYYFGRELRRVLGVPVGLIVQAWGGSSCEAWMDKAHVMPFVNDNSPYQIPVTDKDVKSKNRQPTVLYNGMLHPIIGYGIRGAIWYQGEDNVPRYQDYAEQMKTMVGEWRDEWGIGEFPFYFCQIAPYDYSLIGWNVNSALLREQQLKAEREIPSCGMAVLMDAGIKKGIHPPLKSVAGERLALLAFANTYGIKGISAESARYASMTVEDGKAVISFERDAMNIYGKNSSFTSHLFEIAGEDRVFHPATVELYKRKYLSVYSKDVPNPVAVRYAFHNWADGDLFCDGLPISSFRTDTWEVAPDGAATNEEKDYNNQ